MVTSLTLISYIMKVGGLDDPGIPSNSMIQYILYKSMYVICGLVEFQTQLC